MCRQSEKNLLSSNISSTCPHNMVNFGPQAAEIVSLVCGTPGNFNGFRDLAELLHGTLVVGVSQTAAFNRGRHLYSAGRLSRWALAHISSKYYIHNNTPCSKSQNDFCSFRGLIWLLTRCFKLLSFLWSPYVIMQSIIFLPCDFYLLLLYGRPM